MLDDIYQIPYDKVCQVEWLGDNMLYDLQLYELGQGQDEFVVIIPSTETESLWHTSLKHYIEDIPSTRKCIVFTAVINK